jgi:hypothetical protein
MLPFTAGQRVLAIDLNNLPLQSSWTTPTPGSGWAVGPVSGTVQPIRYRLVGPSGTLNNAVEIVGALHTTSGTPAATVWTMPTGYFNAGEDQRGLCVANSGGTMSVITFIISSSTGAVSISPTIGNTTDLYVNLRFPLS